MPARSATTHIPGFKATSERIKDRTKINMKAQGPSSENY